MPRPLPEKRVSIPPSLGELQRWMRWAITEPRGLRQALAVPWNLDSALNDRYREPGRQLQVIDEAKPYSAQDRLGIYANAYFYRLLESLSADYKTVLRVVGREAFHDIVAQYLMRHPSRSPNIGDVGESFPLFVRDQPLSEHFPFLPELAALERDVLECLFAPHLPPFEAGFLNGRSADEWATARFVLDPAVRLIRVRWPVDLLWRNREQPEPWETPSMPAPEPRPLLLIRDDNWVHISVMDSRAWTALELLGRNLALGKICEALGENASSEPPPLAEWFSSWVAAGILKDVIWEK